MRSFLLLKNMTSQYTARPADGYGTAVIGWRRMAALNLLGICGSTRKASLNNALLRVVGETLPAEATLKTYEGLDHLPIFNSDLEEPLSVVALKRAIASADGVIFAVPEYNYSVPGGLKNALDW